MNYVFIGWYNKDSSDKVWGVIELQLNVYLSFWGRRGKKLQTKIIKTKTHQSFINDSDGDYHGDYVIDDLIKKKVNKGYSKIDKSKLNTVYPEFESDLEKTTVWAYLKV